MCVAAACMYVCSLQSRAHVGTTLVALCSGVGTSGGVLQLLASHSSMTNNTFATIV